MPKLTNNAFITKHTSGTCVLLQFFDFKRLKDAARKAKRPLTTTEGKDVPTPSQVITALVAAFAKGDYTIQSQGEHARTDVRLRVMFSDLQEALELAKMFGPLAKAESFQRGDGRPCARTVAVVVEGEDQMKLAKQLGLF
jgi:hypothetical protein